MGIYLEAFSQCQCEADVSYDCICMTACIHIDIMCMHAYAHHSISKFAPDYTADANNRVSRTAAILTQRPGCLFGSRSDQLQCEA